MIPYIGLDETIRRQAWSTFYSDLNKGNVEAWDKVVSSLEYLVRTMGDNSDEALPEAGKIICEYVSKSDTEVTRLAIVNYLIDYLWSNSYDLGLREADEKNRFVWNSTCDMLRCVKRVRDDEAAFQLPESDKRLTLGFLERLSRPPVKKDYW